MDLTLRGVARQFTQFALGGGELALRMTGNESLAVAQIEPARLDWSRAGYRFAGGLQVIASGIAPVQAIPTTTATLALYNPDREQSLVIERLGFFLGSGTAGAGATLMVCVTEQIAAPVTANAANYASRSLSGGTATPRALWGAAVTIPTNAAWIQAQSNFQTAAIAPGQGDSPVDFEGAIIIPPRCALGIAILSGAGTTPLYGVSGIWSELKLALE